MRGIRNRFKVITQRRVIGEITKDIGIGILVNATYSLSQADFGFGNFLDLVIAVLIIVEGNYIKETG